MDAEIACLHHRIILVPRQRIAGNSIWTLKVRPDAESAGLHFWLFVEYYSTYRVQSNSVPDQLQAVFVPFFGLGLPPQERSRSIGAVHLETVLLADHIAMRWMTNWKSQIMENGRDSMSFPIALLGVW